MNLVLAAAGVVLLVTTMLDVVRTIFVFTPAGGPLTRRMAQGAWRLLSPPRRGRGALYIGPFILLATVTVWLLLTWLAWVLVFYGESGSVVNSQTGEPAPFWARVYFAGFGVFTLGVGDYVPEGAPWQLLTVASAALGFCVITLSITFVLPVVQSVTERRALASRINHMGATPAALLTRHWDGQGFGSLESRLGDLVSDLALLEQRHKTYPILHYFAEDEPQVAAVVALPRLDEALSLLSLVVPGTRPDEALVADIRSIIGDYLDTVAEIHDDFSASAPPSPDLSPVRSAGIPLAAGAASATQAGRDTERRRRLNALVIGHGWDWRQVAGADRPDTGQADTRQEGELDGTR